MSSSARTSLDAVDVVDASDSMERYLVLCYAHESGGRSQYEGNSSIKEEQKINAIGGGRNKRNEKV